jgi:hypothetical protein
MGQEIESEEIRFGYGRLRGTLHHPQRLTKGRAPAIVLGGELSAVREHDLLRYAEHFARAGFFALAFDFRGFGLSSGEAFGPGVATLRQLADPAEQIEDYREAVSFVRGLADVDPDRVAVWGAGLSGGHVVQLAAEDPHIGAIVSQAPVVSGRDSVLDAPGDASSDTRLPVIPEPDSSLPAVFQGADARRYFDSRRALAMSWRNHLLRGSIDLIRSYDPIEAMPQISSPLLMLVAADDDVCHSDLQVLAYRRAPQPKRLHVVQGGHFSFYEETFPEAAAVASAWLSEHLHDQAEANARADFFNSMF